MTSNTRVVVIGGAVLASARLARQLVEFGTNDGGS
jgi:hypothetical protein